MNKVIKKKKTIVLCASITFYKEVIEIKNQLAKAGFKVVVPKLARLMEQAYNFDWDFHKRNYLGEDEDLGKGQAIKRHFEKIEKGDIVLALNYKKRGIDGYIGPNLLMELGVAFYLGKAIYILNKITRKHPFADEIFAMKPIFLDGDLRKIKC